MDRGQPSSVLSVNQMKSNLCSVLSVLVAICSSCCESANILGYFTTFSKSHIIIHMAVINTLVERGHNVTVVTTLPLEDHSPKYRHILLEDVSIDREYLKDAVNVKANKILTIYRTMDMLTDFMDKINATISQPKMQRLMSEESFDLVVLGYYLNDFEMGLAGHFKCPLVVSFSQQGTSKLNQIIGNPSEPLYVPNIFSEFSQPMGFINRLKNLLMSILEALLMRFSIRSQEAYYESNFPADKYPSLEQVQKNISLLLLSTHFSQGIVRPNVPAVIDIGGIQIKPTPAPLPKDIQEFLDSAQSDGAIYFSLGSNARSSELKPGIIGSIYKVLSGLKQKVLWKWEDAQMPGNASNILFKKWLPQDDILAHRNIKAFISHGGLGSVVEAEYHGVPIIGIPLFGDQYANLKAVQESGFGLTIDYHDMTEDSFRKGVLEILENPAYRNSVKKFSDLYRDRPMAAKDTAAFWLEYVIRHRGARHMQSPAVHMNSVQYYGLDLIMFFGAIFYAGYKIIFVVLKLIFRKLFKAKPKAQKTKKNK